MTHIMAWNEWMTCQRCRCERDKHIGFCFGFEYPFSTISHMCLCAMCAPHELVPNDDSIILQKDQKLPPRRTLCSDSTIRFTHFGLLLCAYWMLSYRVLCMICMGQKAFYPITEPLMSSAYFGWNRRILALWLGQGPLYCGLYFKFFLNRCFYKYGANHRFYSISAFSTYILLLFAI